MFQSDQLCQGLFSLLSSLQHLFLSPVSTLLCRCAHSSPAHLPCHQSGDWSGNAVMSQLLVSLLCHSLLPATHTDFRKRHCHVLNSVSFLDTQLSSPGISASRMTASGLPQALWYLSRSLCVQSTVKESDGSPNHWELHFPPPNPLPFKPPTAASPEHKSTPQARLWL